MSIVEKNTILPPIGAPRLAAVALAVATGVAVYLVGLPGAGSLLGVPIPDLTVPAAIIVTLGGAVVALGSRTSGSWRVVEIVVAGILGAVGGVVFALWNVAYVPLFGWMTPPLSALYVGMWIFPAVLGGLVVRRPGAALFTEVVAAVASMLVGTQWGFAVLYYGVAQGLAAELLLALFLYRRFGVVTAAMAGLAAGAACGLLDVAAYALTGSIATWYTVGAAVSGLVIAGLGSWALTRGLARTGVLGPLASGRQAEPV